MVVRVEGLDPADEQPADLRGGERDQVFAAGRPFMITRLAFPGKLSTGAGAPLSMRTRPVNSASVTGSARFLVAADYGGGRYGVKVERPADERP